MAGLCTYILSLKTESCYPQPFKISGKEHEFEVKNTDTIYDLKLLYEEEEGIVPNHQTYFCGPVPIESDEILVSSVIEFYGTTLDLKLKKAATLQTDKDVAVVYGPDRNNFKTVNLRPGGREKIEFKKGKFGIVTHTATSGVDKTSGENVYTVERYKLPSDKEQNVVLKSEGGDTVAFLVTSTGEELRLKPEVMEYKIGKTPLERVNEVIKAVNCIVEWGKQRLSTEQQNNLFLF